MGQGKGIVVDEADQKMALKVADLLRCMMSAGLDVVSLEQMSEEPLSHPRKQLELPRRTNLMVLGA